MSDNSSAQDGKGESTEVTLVIVLNDVRFLNSAQKLQHHLAFLLVNCVL